MAHDTASEDGSTRRNYLKYGSAIIGGGLLAGCTDTSNSGAAQAEPEATTATEAANDSDSTETDQSYTVTMEPVGDVTFESVPESWYVDLTGIWIDMGFALGQMDGWIPSAEFPGAAYFQDLGIDVVGEYPMSEWGQNFSNEKEKYYQLSPDVILADPTDFDSNWSDADITEIETNVAPFFGASIRRPSSDIGYEPPEFYDAFGKLAEVFQEQDRYEAFVEVRENVLETATERLPPDEERPTVGIIEGDPTEGTFRAYRIYEGGLEQRQYLDLGMQEFDAFDALSLDGSEIRGSTDYEGLLQADPDVLFLLDAMRITRRYISVTDGTPSFDGDRFRENIIRPMEEDPTGQRLTAVEEGRVYPGGVAGQGPLTNLYNIDLLARQVHPEEFGSFDLDNPLDIPEEEGLFDRDHVADIINGNI